MTKNKKFINIRQNEFKTPWELKRVRQGKNKEIMSMIKTAKINYNRKQSINK